MKNALQFSLADFHHNDSPYVLDPPHDYLEWINDASVQQGMQFFGRPLLRAPNNYTQIIDIDGVKRDVINFTSYNYLGLSTHPEVLQAAKDAIDLYGMSAAGAPLVSGTLDLHLQFCQKIATLKKQDDAIMFSSGYGGNLGSIQALLHKGDYLILDEKSHKSLIDGGILSGAKLIFFKHNDELDLEQYLQKLKGKRILVATESVFSMDGDIVRLPQIHAVCKSYNVPLYMDEAHSSLMFGQNGGGIGEYFNLKHAIDINFGTLSKSFGGVGGFVTSNQAIINYMKGYASAWNFSCGASPPIVAAMIKSLEIATRDSVLRDKLWHNVAYLKENLLAMNLNLGKTESQVIPIIIGSSGELLIKYAGAMQRRGLFLQPVDYPAVPAHERRFRMSVSAQFTQKNMDDALTIIRDVLVHHKD